jgi:hypothetical protein
MMETPAVIFALIFALGFTPAALADSGAVTAQFHGSAQAGCPERSPAATSTASRAASGALVPKGATSLLLCRYHGLNPSATADRLERSRLIKADAEIAQLTAELDKLPASTGVIHCPMDDGSEIAARFEYPRQSDVSVIVGLTGCRTVSRDGLARAASGPAGTRVINQLMTLVPT